MNQNNNQVQQSSQVSQEELAKTQVLNLTDVQEIAKFERKTSKRPAVLFAIAGILSLTLGFSYPNIISTLDAMPSRSVSDSIPVEVDTTLNRVQENITTCKFTSPENPDGTTGTATYNFEFSEVDQLKNYTMTLEMDPLAGNANGLVSIQNIYNAYKVLDTIPVDGYNVQTTYTKTGMKSVVTVNLATINRSALTSAHYANYFAQVPYNLGDAKETIVQNLTANNYICK